MELLDRFREVVENKGVSAYEIAKDTGLEQSTISRILNGNTKKSRNDTLVKIAKYMHSKFNIYAFEGLNIIKENSDSIKTTEVIKTKQGLVWEKLPDGTYNVTVDEVPFEAHGKYLSDDVEYFEEWDKVTFNVSVERPGRGNYLGFKHKGDSMINPDNPGFYDVKDKMKSLGRELGRQHWQDGFQPKGFGYGWILITKRNILHKDIADYNLENGMLTLSSRNPDPKHAPFEISVNDVYQIFKIMTVNH